MVVVAAIVAVAAVAVGADGVIFNMTLDVLG